MNYESIIHKGKMYVDYESYRKLLDQMLEVNKKYVDSIAELASINIRQSGRSCKMVIMKGGKV